jgi:hypothetical protein
MTAMPHPKVMTIQPEFWALDLFNRTPATTPSPKRTRMAVPIVSAPMMLNETPLLERKLFGTPARPWSDPIRGALRKSTESVQGARHAAAGRRRAGTAGRANGGAARGGGRVVATGTEV